VTFDPHAEPSLVHHRPKTPLKAPFTVPGALGVKYIPADRQNVSMRRGVPQDPHLSVIAEKGDDGGGLEARSSLIPGSFRLDVNWLKIGRLPDTHTEL